MGEFQNDGAIRLAGTAFLIVNQEQVVSWPIDPIQPKVDAKFTLDAVVLQSGFGQPTVGEIVIDLDVAHFGRKIAERQVHIIQPEANIKREIS